MFQRAALVQPLERVSRVGFRLDLTGGPASALVNALEPGEAGYLQTFQQAYVSYLAPVGSGLQIDAGKFVTPAGAETIETRDNWNYSRSFLFALAIPYYHMGVRTAYRVNASMVSVEMFSTFFFIRRANCCAKCRTSIGMSSRRSRSGGTVIGNTFRR